MKNDVKFLNLSNKVPVRFSVIEFDQISPHMHKDLQILIVLDGSFSISIENDTYHLNEGDTISINRKQIHSLTSQNKAVVLSVIIDLESFDPDTDFDSISFDLNSTLESNSNYDKFKYLIYSLIVFNSQNNVNSVYNNKAIAYSLFAELNNDFKNGISSNIFQNKQFNSITTITSYINNHYRDNLTLNELSSGFGYSVAYLSKMFKKNVGLNFIDYYDKLRVDYSMDDLMSGMSIEEISMAHGFENSRSYVRAFNNIYKTNPSKYRKNGIHKTGINETNANELISMALDKVNSFYNSYNPANNKIDKPRNTNEEININLLNATEQIDNPVTKIMHLGNFHYLFYTFIHDNLKQVLSDIHFEYMYLHSIVSSTGIIIKNDDSYSINYLQLNFLMGYLKEFNISPYFELKFDYEDNIFEIKNVIMEFLNNLRSYKKNIILSIDFKSSKKFNYALFIDVYHTIMANYQNVKIASPCFLDLNEFSDYLSAIKKHTVKIDYYRINYTLCRGTKETRIKDPNDFNNFINKLKEKKMYFKKQMIFNNVNFTNEVRNLLNDTIYKSSYLVKNIIDNLDDIVVFSPVFDSTISNIVPSSYYDGFRGMYTYNNIQKAAFKSIFICSKISKNLIKKSKNYIITRDGGKIYIVLNNYIHYSDLYAEDDYFKIDNTNRYRCFSKSTNINFEFKFDNIDSEEVRIKTYLLSKENGSSYDKFMSIWGDSKLSGEDEERLKEITLMQYQVSHKQIKNKTLEMEYSLEPLESMLIEIKL